MSKVKICGLRSFEDIAAVNSAMPDYIGFVFAESRRRIDFETATMLKNRLDGNIKAVGVFVNENAEIIIDLCNHGVIDMIQLHGDEDGKYIENLKNSCSCPVIKSVSVYDAIPAYPKNADFLLFDTLSTQRGGSGEAFQHEILIGFNEKPYFIAGGLTVHNISQAITMLQPYGVDTSSGVETNGLKDPIKIHDFVKAVRTSTT
ncbi:MAG: phosphoribosylanthranilate isomerase [Oscillospiraceae bacterium]|nr:phosphoribosylanthranilate isomerase [Oscillospiraceae bacterium]